MKIAVGAGALLAAICVLSARARSDEQDRAPSLEEVRLTMGKWIETQQILARERNDWHQGKEILVGRLELVKREIATLEQKLAEAQAGVARADAAKSGLQTEKDALESCRGQLDAAVTRLENEIRRMHPSLPEAIQTRLQPLFQRMPDEAARAKVSVAERFQNVLGILNDLNKSNREVAVQYEVRTLSDGAPSEVKAIYVGLAQAYYVSARGEAGIGRPGPEGWVWEPSKSIADDVVTALEILQGTHSPAFVPLPAKLQ